MVKEIRTTLLKLTPKILESLSAVHIKNYNLRKFMCEASKKYFYNIALSFQNIYKYSQLLKIL